LNIIPLDDIHAIPGIKGELDAKCMWANMHGYNRRLNTHIIFMSLFGLDVRPLWSGANLMTNEPVDPILRIDILHQYLESVFGPSFQPHMLMMQSCLWDVVTHSERMPVLRMDPYMSAEHLRVDPLVWINKLVRVVSHVMDRFPQTLVAWRSASANKVPGHFFPSDVVAINRIAASVIREMNGVYLPIGDATTGRGSNSEWHFTMDELGHIYTMISDLLLSQYPLSKTSDHDALTWHDAVKLKIQLKQQAEKLVAASS
jgi:hypothetical protein